jgi:hypothetical protein
VARLGTDFRRSDLRLLGSAWARQAYPSALRGLDPPGALPIVCAIIGAPVDTEDTTDAVHVGRDNGEGNSLPGLRPRA